MTDQISDKERSAYFFKQVESFCGVARLSIATAIEDASLISNEELRADAIETLQGTLQDILDMYKGESSDERLSV